MTGERVNGDPRSDRTTAGQQRLVSQLDRMVERGQVTAEGAEANLKKLRQGEHPKRLRSHLRKLARQRS
jgi:hypothetical protein